MYPRPQIASSLFLSHNAALGPPYRVLVDTNFINFSLQNKLELVSGMMDCLYAKCKQVLFFVYLHLIERSYRYSLHYRLRYGRIGETRTKIPNSVKVCGPYSLQEAFSECLCVCRVARDPRFERLSCTHKGTYADDCLIERITSHKCYIVATCDKELRRRVRKVPGVPLMYIVRRKYAIERLPDGGAPV